MSRPLLVIRNKSVNVRAQRWWSNRETARTLVEKHTLSLRAVCIIFHSAYIEIAVELLLCSMNAPSFMKISRYVYSMTDTNFG